MKVAIGIYKSGKLRQMYSDRGKAVLALAMAKEIQPEHHWELKEISKDSNDTNRCRE